MDKIDKSARSKNMAKIKATNTSPELLIRKKLYSLGYRFRIHYNLYGKPDIVFPALKLAIFVNGCFWHNHKCKFDHNPKSNVEFWSNKRNENKKRDLRNYYRLKKYGWNYLVLWECKIEKNIGKEVYRIIDALNKRSII